MTEKNMDFNIKKIAVDPDDIVLVECNGQLKPQQLELLKDQVKLAFPNNKCVILDKDVKLRKVIFTDDVSKMSQAEFGEYIDSIREKIDEPEERKLIGYTEREEGYYKMYAPAKGSIVTQAFILCKYCNGVIYHVMGPRSDAVCLTCYAKEPELR